MAMSRRHYEAMAETVRCLRWSISSRSEWEAVRDEIAERLATPSYNVCYNRVVRNMASMRPSSLTALGALQDLGKPLEQCLQARW